MLGNVECSIIEITTILRRTLLLGLHFIIREILQATIYEYLNNKY